MSVSHYGFRGLRLPLTHIIVESMTRRDQEEFWSVYCTGDGTRFGEILRRVDARIRQSVHDARLSEVLGDAFAWAIAHPKEVLDFTRDEGDAPNMISFGLLMDGIHSVLDGTRVRVRKFVHDDQEQFGRFMQMWYPFLRRFTLGTDATTFSGKLQRIVSPREAPTARSGMTAARSRIRRGRREEA